MTLHCQGYVPPNVTSGQVSIIPALLVPDTRDVLPVVEDLPAVPAKKGTQTLWFNVDYERVRSGLVGHWLVCLV